MGRAGCEIRAGHSARRETGEIMREKEIWDASIEPIFHSSYSEDTYTIKAFLDRDGRDIRVNIPVEQKQTARWLAKALLEWAGPEEA